MRLLRDRREGINRLAHNIGKINLRLGQHMFLPLDLRQGQEIINQARHAPTLIAHNGQKALARFGIILGSPL